MKCWQIIDELEQLSPIEYACEWDNVGLLVGRKDKEVRRVMVALDATCEVVDYAVEKQVDMLITHHPMLFSSVKQINETNFVTNKALQMIENGISYYAMHTNFDIVGGMAELVCGSDYLNLNGTMPISCEQGQTEGLGRYGALPRPMTAEQVAEWVKKCFGLPFVMLYQNEKMKDKLYDRIAVLPGSGKSEMKQVYRDGYELYLTGDYTHHEALDAMDMGMTVIDATHYGLEHVFVSYIGNYIRKIAKNHEIEVIEADMGCPARIL